MTINQIRYVLEIAKSSSMRAAANKLFISQPALTSSIAELEQELGILLFERTNKGVSLTDDGREFVIYAKKVMQQYEILENKYDSSSNAERFSVSSQHYNFAVQAFAELVNEFDMDQYLFSFHETRTSHVLSNVRDMRSEIGIIAYSEDSRLMMEKIFKTYNLKFYPLMRRETYAYVWHEHEFADRDQISLRELKNYPCILFDQSEEEEHYLNEEALANESFEKIIKSDDRATSMELIARTNGYSIGSGMLSDEDAILKGLVSVKLEEEDPLTIGYIHRRNAKLSEYAKRYISLLEGYREL